MQINLNLNQIQTMVAKEYKEFGLDLDKNIIDGDFVKFSVDITLKKFNNASVLISGTIGNHGYGYFEAVFDEIAVTDESLIAINAYNDNVRTVKACISRRGNPGKYYAVFSKGVQYIPDEQTMVDLSSRILTDLTDDDDKPLIEEILHYLK